MAEDQISRLQLALHEFAEARDWNQFHDAKNLSMALVVEAGELVEILQWLTAEEASKVMEEPRTAAAIREELADVFGYLLRIADILDVSLVEALDQKLEVNEDKYPIIKSKGNAKKYTEL